MARFFDRMQPFTLLVLRVVLGCALISASYSKIIPHGGFHGNNTFAAIEHWNACVLRLGMPAWLGTISALGEFLGGFCLIAGLFTRFFGGLNTLTLLVAVIKVTLHSYEASKYPLACLALAFVAMTFGAGSISLDDRLGWE
jgi:putative oxidoreductase